jgi:hypothetical protein
VEGDDGDTWFTHQIDSKASTYSREKNLENVTMDLDGIQRMIVGRTSRFRWLVCYSLDNSIGRFVGKVFAHLGRWMISSNHLW